MYIFYPQTSLNVTFLNDNVQFKFYIPKQIIFPSIWIYNNYKKLQTFKF